MVTKEDRKNADLVLRQFVVPLEGIFEPLEEAVRLAPPLVVPSSEVFLGNLKSALTVASIPYILTNSSVIQARFRAIHVAEQIRARKTLDPDGQPTAESLEEARGTANRRMDEEMRSAAAVERLSTAIVDNLALLLHERDFSSAAQELLLETIVMVWGSFEVFVTETLRVTLNSNPRLASELLADESAKKHFPPRGISLELLAKHEFNVAGAMGDVLLTDRHMDSLPVIKDVLGVVFAEQAGLRQKLASRELWILSQRRHLIAHRRGAVDASYLANTGENLKIGERLTVASGYIFEALELVRNVAIELLGATSKRASSSSP